MSEGFQCVLHENKLELVKALDGICGDWEDVSFESLDDKLASVMAVVEVLRLGDSTRSHI
jgi:hypothetical protein